MIINDIRKCALLGRKSEIHPCAAMRSNVYGVPILGSAQAVDRPTLHCHVAASVSLYAILCHYVD